MPHLPTTIQEARQVLSRPPVFGDEEQIAAIKFLEDAEIAKGITCKCRPCLMCSGTGGVRDLCDECSGNGRHWTCWHYKGLNPWAVWSVRAMRGAKQT